jgi:hypothetical protein
MNPQQFLNDLLRSLGLNAGPNITGTYTPEENVRNGQRVTTGQGTTEVGASSPLNGDPRRQQNTNSRVTSGGGGRNSGGGSGRVTSGGGSASPGGAGRNLLMNRADLLGGATSALPYAPGIALGLQDLTQGRAVEGTVNLVGGGLSGAVGANIGRRVGGPKGALIGTGVGLVGSFLSDALGQVAENTLAEKRGKPVAGREESSAPAAARGQARKNMDLNLEFSRRQMDQFVAGNIDLMEAASNQVYLDNQRNAPMIKKYLDEQMVRQQALNASNTSNYAMLGTVATAGKLATGAQAEAGETMRTMLRNNPYAGSVMQAPNISFG